MRYVCLVYTDEGELEKLSEAEIEAFSERCVTHDRALRSRGRVLASERLHPAHTATTLRVRDERISVTDGPFAATNEQLGGFYLIDARDLNDAIRTASAIPSARRGAIEVRPVRKGEGS